MKKTIFLLAIILMSCSGCVPVKPVLDGSDRDSHGCISSAGYTWCENRKKCVRMWEEECGDVIHVCYECEKLGRVSADFTTGKSGNVVIFMDDGIKKLERDVSGSGARFTKADTEFWDKGGDARLTIGGSVYNCKMQKECR